MGVQVGRPVYAPPTYMHPQHSPPFAQPVSQAGYGKGAMAASFAGGALIGAGGMYMYDRMGTPRHGLYSNGFGSHYHPYHGDRSHSTVVHHHHHYDGPYYERQWNSVPSGAYTDLARPSTAGLHTLPKKKVRTRSMEAVLCIDALKNGTTLKLHYRQHGEKEIQTYDMNSINSIVGGAKDLGSIGEQMQKNDFTQLQAGLDHYVPRLEKRTRHKINGRRVKITLIGIALNVKIGVLPSYMGNVTEAQEALELFEWKNTKAKLVVARVVSAAWQAQMELESQWSQGYTGFMSLTRILGVALPQRLWVRKVMRYKKSLHYSVGRPWERRTQIN